MPLQTRVINLLYPPACTLCHRAIPRADTLLCDACRADLVPLRTPLCAACGQTLSGAFDLAASCGACRRRPPAFEAARAPWLYRGPMPRAIQAFKYRGRWRVGRWLASEMAHTARERMPVEEIDAILPVPLHWLKRWVKGWNPAEDLAVQVARAVRKPLARGALRRVRWTKSQTRLQGRARRRNVAHAFVAAERLVAGRTLLLVDDVLTTGATAEACAAALTRAGARRVFVLTAARTPTHDR